MLHVFYDNEILSPKLAPSWLINVKVIDIMHNLGVSGTGPVIIAITN